MRIQITKPGIYDGEGKEVPVGTELTLKEEPKGWRGRYSVLTDPKGKKAVTNPADAPEAPEGPFTVQDDGKGWFSIRDGKGEKVGKALREDDAKAFETLSDEDKAAFATEHAKG